MSFGQSVKALFYWRQINPHERVKILIPIDTTLHLMFMFATLVLLIVDTRGKK